MTRLGRNFMNSGIGRSITNNNFINSTSVGRRITNFFRPREDSRAPRNADRIEQPQDITKNSSRAPWAGKEPMQERYRKALGAKQRGQSVPEVTHQPPEPGFYKA